MNALEHYIEEVKKVEKHPFEADVKIIKDNGVEETRHCEFKNAVIAFMKVNCYGVEQDVEKIYADKKELEKDLERGYYMA